MQSQQILASMLTRTITMPTQLLCHVSNLFLE